MITRECIYEGMAYLDSSYEIYTYRWAVNLMQRNILTPRFKNRTVTAFPNLRNNTNSCSKGSKEVNLKVKNDDNGTNHVVAYNLFL